jgi:alpha-D-xyloside xylohydrolase
LPSAPGWYDFWSGARLSAGSTVEASAPLERIPVYVRAGSILPLGPMAQNADIQPDTLEVRVYAGADGDFEWYSDAGDSYDYEKGRHRIVPMHWDDAARTLILGESAGSYPGMPRQIQIQLIVVRDAHGVGGNLTEAVDGEGVYKGKGLRIKAR